MSSRPDINFKAKRFSTKSNVSSMLYEIKSSRAIWDPSLSVPGTNRRGGWRCPEGSSFGGQITDRFGRNCGWGVSRRLGRATDTLGRTLRDAAAGISAGERRSTLPGNVSPRLLSDRQFLEFARGVGFSIDGGKIGDIAPVEAGDFLKMIDVLEPAEAKKEATKMRKAIRNKVRRRQNILRDMPTNAVKAEPKRIQETLDKLKTNYLGLMGKYVEAGKNNDFEEQQRLAKLLQGVHKDILAETELLEFANQFIKLNYTALGTREPETPEPPDSKEFTPAALRNALEQLNPMQSRNGGRAELVRVVNQFISGMRGADDDAAAVLVDYAYEGAVIDEQDLFLAGPRISNLIQRVKGDPDKEFEVAVADYIDDLEIAKKGGDIDEVQAVVQNLIGLYLRENAQRRYIAELFPNGEADIFEAPSVMKKPNPDVVDKFMRPKQFQRPRGSLDPDNPLLEVDGGDGVGPIAKLFEGSFDTGDISDDFADDDFGNEVIAKLFAEEMQAIKDYKQHGDLDLIPRRHWYAALKRSGKFTEVRGGGAIGDTRILISKSNPNLGYVFKRDRRDLMDDWYGEGGVREIFGHHFAAALGFPNGVAFMDGVGDLSDYEDTDEDDLPEEIRKGRFVVIPFAFRHVPNDAQKVDGNWVARGDLKEDNYQPGELDEVEDAALPARLAQLMMFFAMAQGDRHGDNAFGQAFVVNGENVPVIMPIDFGNFENSSEEFFNFIEEAMLERREGDNDMEGNFKGVVAQHMIALRQREKSEGLKPGELQKEFRMKMVQAFDVIIERMQKYVDNSDSEAAKIQRAVVGDMLEELEPPESPMGEILGYHSEIKARLAILKRDRKEILEGLLNV